MGYSLVKFFKTNKEFFITVLLQIIATALVVLVCFISNYSVMFLFLPFLNALIIYILCKNNHTTKKLVLTWLNTCFLFAIGILYMGVRNSSLGALLLFFVHFYGFTLSYLFCIICFKIKNKP